MSIYPISIDSDATIARIDDNLSELGTDAINQLRDAVFNIENELGIGLRGSKTSLTDRLNVFLNTNGTLKASALTSVGLATLPISDNQVAINAGIKEYKLSLDHSTSDLYTIISSNAILLSSLNAFVNTVSADFINHLKGAKFLSDGTTSARHVASQIDLNKISSDSRDPFFNWDGLLDKNNAVRSSKTVAEALAAINTDLVNHENSTGNAHLAAAVVVDTSNFIEIPTTADTVQKVVDYLNDAEVLNIGEHRAVQHANGIPPVARTEGLLADGYATNVVPSTSATTYLVHNPNTMPVDDLSVGDDIIKFTPNNTDFVFDAAFSQVRVGDVARVTHSNIEVSYLIDSIRYTPGTEWIIRINGTNLLDDGYALVRIDRSEVDRDTNGILAVAAANGIPTTSFSSTMSSVIVGHPRGASALGLEFDSNQLDSTHYLLWIELYPTGNPNDKVISLAAIDVTGNVGVTPGSYTLEDVVQATNNSFRNIGYNYRFIAFARRGEFGIMLADPIGGASFAIISGVNSAGTLATGSFTNNVIGGSSADDFDSLGFGVLKANVASPSYQNTFADTTSAQIPTKVIVPKKRRNYIVNGQKRDNFAATYLANSDGYWDGYISARTPVAAFTVETTYTILLNLEAAGLRPGKTLVIQPAIEYSDVLYSDVDYGRFVIKNINFVTDCGGSNGFTQITVINGIHGTGVGFGFSSSPNLPVRIYFSADSVSFNSEEVIDTTPATSEYHRLHEIYIDQHGKTFSHERARLPRQSEDSTPGFLATDRWHVKGVSSKLRGYRDSSPLVFNKYVRLYVLSFDSTSGIFDGYLGQRITPASSQITNAGKIVSGRKNVITRFYDETNIDYIDLEFVETSAYPGVNILSDSTPRYVDIELFPSLHHDDEVMMLATCEINWSPAAGQDIVEYVTDTRQFGSISEIDFTDSAINYISAGDRYLHENGIIRGLDFDTINSTDNRELFYKGGVALVNGKIVTVNDSSVTIPQVYTHGTSLPQTVTWAVCVNEFNDLVPTIITTTAMQFFATTGSGSFYLPSTTFVELVQTRKDLCPISLVTAHIASFTITPATDILDVRKFILDSGAARSLSLTSSETSGTFHSFDSVKNWINNFGNNATIINLKGTFDISTSVDLTGYTNPVIFDGDGATINVTCLKGLLIGSNVTFRNVNFTYTPSSLAYTTGDIVNTGNGCLYGATTVTSNLLNINIENCKFSSNLSQIQRPPYINFEINNGQKLDYLNIINNDFSDTVDTYNQAIVAIVTLRNAISTAPAILSNCIISGNRCDRDQGIFTTAISSLLRPGLNIFNTIIEKNHCGIIGYFCTSIANSVNTTTALGLTINNNTCHYIETSFSDGINIMTDVSISQFPFGFGSVIISNNYCNWIHVTTGDGDTSSPNSEFCALNITNNIMTAYDYDGFLKDVFLSGDVGANTAIMVAAYLLSAKSDITAISITDNNINSGKYNSTTYKYISGIYSAAGAIIRGNIVKGFAKVNDNWLDGNGIIASGLDGNSIRRFMITGNKIYRNSNTIVAYVSVGSADGTDPQGVCTDNFFDSVTIDGSTATTLDTLGFGWVVDRNINQIVTTEVSAVSGRLMLGGALGGAAVTTAVLSTTSALSPTASLSINYVTANQTTPLIQWILSLNDLLPPQVTIVDVALSGKSNTTYDTLGTISMVIEQLNPSVTASSAGLDFTGAYVPNVVLTCTATPTNTTAANTVKTTPGTLVTARAYAQVKDTTNGNTYIYLSAFTIRYRY